MYHNIPILFAFPAFLDVFDFSFFGREFFQFFFNRGRKKNDVCYDAIAKI